MNDNLGSLGWVSRAHSIETTHRFIGNSVDSTNPCITHRNRLFAIHRHPSLKSRSFATENDLLVNLHWVIITCRVLSWTSGVAISFSVHFPLRIPSCVIIYTPLNEVANYIVELVYWRISIIVANCAITMRDGDFDANSNSFPENVRARRPTSVILFINRWLIIPIFPIGYANSIIDVHNFWTFPIVVTHMFSLFVFRLWFVKWKFIFFPPGLNYHRRLEPFFMKPRREFFSCSIKIARKTCKALCCCKQTQLTNQRSFYDDWKCFFISSREERILITRKEKKLRIEYVNHPAVINLFAALCVSISVLKSSKKFSIFVCAQNQFLAVNLKISSRALARWRWTLFMFHPASEKKQSTWIKNYSHSSYGSEAMWTNDAQPIYQYS